MTLMQMKYAIAVADTKSMNEAARSLFITQPSLSASVKELENEIGMELFKRTNRGITVTPEGEEFLRYVHVFLRKSACPCIQITPLKRLPTIGSPSRSFALMHTAIQIELQSKMS